MIRGASSGTNWPASVVVDDSSFLGIIRSKTGLDGLDLPTEAQWEYAARSGTTTDYGNGTNYSSVGQDLNMDVVGRYQYNGGSPYSLTCMTSAGTAKVGSYAPNVWGLYDMHGNVWEWCLDWYGTQKSGVTTNPRGPSSGDSRVVCGGGFGYSAGACTAASRIMFGSSPASRNHSQGFRLCCPTGLSEDWITFDGNGCETPVAPRTVTSGQPVGELPVVTRAGYTFDGWYTEADGGVEVSPSMIVTGDVTYYAHWVIVVKFDANGGTCSMTSNSYTNNSTLGTLPTPTRTGCSFAGW